MPGEVVGSARIRIEADGSGVSREVQAVGNEMSRSLNSAAASAGRAVGSTLAAGFAAATTAATALGAATIGAGASFNSLSQGVTTALTAVLGTRDAANGLIAEVIELNATAAFSRQAFLAATQQLVGFGVEADQVTTTLDAIQQATVAVGGGEAEFTRITEALARVESEGQLTAGTLGILGRLGLNVIDIIAETTGQSVASVEELMQAGQIGLEDITRALNTRFAGAVEGYADTWQGATGMILAAIRNIGSALVEPFIALEEGGAAVEGINMIADALFRIQGEVIPGLIPYVEGLAASFVDTTRAAAGLLDAIPADAFDQIAATFQGLGPLVVGVGAALATSFGGALPIIGGFMTALNPVVVGVSALVAASPELRSAFSDAFAAILDAAAPLVPVVTDLARQMLDTLVPVAVELLGLFANGLGLEVFASAAGAAMSAVSALLQVLRPVTGLVDSFAEAMAELPGPIQATVAGLVAFRAFNLASVLTPATNVVRRFGEQMAVQATLATQAGASVGRLGAASAAASVQFGRAATALRGVVAALGGPIVVGIGAAIAAVTALSDAISQSDDELREWADSLTEGIAVDNVEGQLGRLRAELTRLSDQTDIGQWDLLADHFLGWETSGMQAAERITEVKDRIAELEARERDAARQAEEQIAAIDGVSESQARYARQLGLTAEEVQELSNANQQTVEAFQQSAVGFTDTLGAWESASQRAAEAAAEAAGEGADAWEQFTDDAVVSLREFEQALDEQIEAQRNWATNLALLAAEVPPEVLSHLSSLGPEAAPLIQELVDATDAELRNLIPKIQATMPAASEALSTELARWSQVAGPIADQFGTDVANRIAGQIAAGKITVDQAMAQLGLSIQENLPGDIEISADIDDAPFRRTATTVQEAIGMLNGSRPTVTADLSPTPFNDALAGLNKSIRTLDSERPTPVANLNTAPFDEQTAQAQKRVGELDAQRPTPRADMNLAEFMAQRNQANALLDMLNSRRAEPDADLNDSPLRAGVNRAQNAVNSLRGKTVTAGAEVYGESSVWNLFNAISSLFDRTVTVTTVHKQVGELSRAAKGAIVNSPQVFEVGEAGPEVIIPLTDPARARALAQQSGLTDILGSPSLSASGSTLTAARTQTTAAGTPTYTFEEGAIKVITPARDPVIVAEMVLDRLAEETD